MVFHIVNIINSMIPGDAIMNTIGVFVTIGLANGITPYCLQTWTINKTINNHQ